MNITDFLAQMLDVMQRDEDISPTDLLENIEEWDSMSAMAFMAYLERKHGKTENFTAIHACKTVQDLFNLTQGKRV